MSYGEFKREVPAFTRNRTAFGFKLNFEPKSKSKPKLDKNILDKVDSILDILNSLNTDDKISTINQIKVMLHRHSPFINEPVDCVLWIKSDKVEANDYNPNTVAPPEMRLLEHSILEDGYTQPIVVWKNSETCEVIDGFHRNRVGKELESVRTRVYGYLPVSIINESRVDRSDRIAATIRHDRARGKHQVDGMSDIVVELKARNWTNERIAKNLGMDQDEILRLCQITGLEKLFTDQEFSKSWDIEDSEPEFIPLTEEFDIDEEDKFRTINTNDAGRIFHTYDKWECYKVGLYAPIKEGVTKDQCEQAYADFLGNTERFSDALEHVISEWKHSCEHYLTNESMNRIAWLGQASMCYATGIPATYRSGFNLLPDEGQNKANKVALAYLNKWLESNGRDKVKMEEALS